MTRVKMNPSSVIRLAALCVVVTMLAGCSSTYQMRSVKPSGFLGDYSELRKGTGDEALMIYIDPKAKFAEYNAIIIDPITLYGTDNGWFSKASKEDRQSIVNYLHTTLAKQLSENYKLVDKPGPRVMRLRVAITEANASNVVTDTVSSIVPIGIAVSALKRVAFGTNLSVGAVSVEAELRDADTNVRLMAAVDARAGRKYTFKFDKWSKWHTVRDAFDYWALRLKNRLAEFSAVETGH